MNRRTLTEPPRQSPISGDYEVAVLGGGPAGIAPRRVNVGGLQRRLELDGAFLGPITAPAE
jgi:hypothetical protein